MLKKFLLNSLSSFVGAWIALALFGVAAVVSIIALVASFDSGDSPAKLTSNSILRIQLAGEIQETESPQGLDYVELLQGSVSAPQTLSSLVQAIREAADNKKVKGIYLECGGLSASPATLHALRAELADFKKSGKKIYAYGDSYGQGDYYVATVADSLFLNPQGTIALQGLGGTNLYMKDFFDKIGVQFEVVKVGTFKSAVEPYISNEMSQPARAQLDTLYGVMWKYIRDEIAQSRKIESANIDSLISRDFIFLKRPSVMQKKELVDRCVYKRQVNEILADLAGVEEKKLNLIEPSVLLDQTDWGSFYSSGKQVAVLYATGEIMEGSADGIDCERLVPQIVELADNDDVKGMVLRVNSPGGSVFGSAQIGEALEYFQSKGKKLAVSMGDYAASGGYWISASADRIFADPLTVTGSIGIFGLIPNASGLAEKIGVTPQTVSTNPTANFPTFFYPMTESQHAAMQAYVEEGYDQFVSRVAKGRDMSKKKVLSIAEGRVWSAMTAKEIGLVDQLGSLQDAVKWVADKSGLGDSYEVAVYPKLNPTFWDMMAEQGLQSEALDNLRATLEKETTDRRLVQLALTVLRRKQTLALMPPMKVTL